MPVPVQLHIIYPHPTKNILNPYYKSQYFKNPGHKNKKGTEEQISLKSSVLYGEGGVKNPNRCAEGLWKHILTLKRKGKLCRGGGTYQSRQGRGGEYLTSDKTHNRNLRKCSVEVKSYHYMLS